MKQYIPFRKKQTLSEQIMEQVTDAANKITEQAATKGSTVKKQASGAASSLKSQATETASSLKNQASGTAASLKHQASDAATTRKTQASGTASSLAAQVSDRVRETSASGDQLSKDVKALAMQAATAAVEILENARDRSHAALDSAPTREQLGLTSAGVSVRAKSAETALIEQAQRLLDLAKQLEQPIGMSVAVAKEKSTLAATAAKEKSSLAATAAKEKSAVAASEATKAGKNGAAIALWSTALVAIVLYIIMGKERREKTIKRAKAAAAEVQDLVRDYRGYDGELETETV